MEYPSVYDPRSRRACEPCRRKKAKCPAEKPVCSVCQRLNQPCEYRLRDAGKGNTRIPAGPKKKGATSLSNESVENNLSTFDGALDPSEPSLSIAILEPPSEVLRDLIEIYKTRIDHQPLPLFIPESLHELMTLSPRFLLYTFLALTLSLHAHPFYAGSVSDAIEYYASSAESTMKNLSFRATARLEVIQALCLQALREILTSKPGQAWTTMGIASRLETYRSLIGNNMHSASVDPNLSARCHWSVYILEALFGPQHCVIVDVNDRSPHPRSAPFPPDLPTGSSDDSPSDLYNFDKSVEDSGITTYYIQRVTIWNKLSVWLYHIRRGKSEISWASDSTYTMLNSALFEVESRLPHKHLFRNVCFSKRSSAEFAQQREYWVAWVLMQAIAHAAPAILNHPFVHLVALKDAQGSPPSALFLQQTVDQCLFHSGWVYRLLRICENRGFEVEGPLLGHLVAALATIQWMFQFTFDEKISQKAMADLKWCKEYLTRASVVWPHLYQKVEILEKLQATADYHRRDMADGGNSIIFRPSYIWALLSPDICQTVPSERDQSSDEIPNTRVRITTHFTHPLVESVGVDTSKTDSDPLLGLGDSWHLNSDELEQVYLNDLVAHFLPRNELDFDN